MSWTFSYFFLNYAPYRQRRLFKDYFLFLWIFMSIFCDEIDNGKNDLYPFEAKSKREGKSWFFRFFFCILISLASSQFITTSEGYHDPDWSTYINCLSPLYWPLQHSTFPTHCLTPLYKVFFLEWVKYYLNRDCDKKTL